MNIKIRKRVNAVLAKLVFKPGKLTALRTELSKLRQELQEFQRSSDPLSDIVRFFNITSKWYDSDEVDSLITDINEINYGQYNKMILKLQEFQNRIKLAGRCKYGMNRTRCGEMVTDSNVYLGNIHGLFTRPVSFWKRNEDKEAVAIVSRQARDFMTSHVNPIVAILDDLLK